MHHHLKRVAIAAALLSALHSYAAETTAQATSSKTGTGRKALLQRIETLEKQLGEMQQILLAQQGQPSKNSQPTEPVAGNKVVVARLNEMEARLATVETTAVLSEPKTAVKQIQVYVDADGNQYDHPVEGAMPTLTYQRERVYRRQTIREEIEEALAAEKNGGIELRFPLFFVFQRVVVMLPVFRLPAHVASR